MGIYNLPKFQVPIYFGLGEESDTKMSLTICMYTYLYVYLPICISPYNLTVYIMVPWPVRKILTFRGELLAKSYKLKGQK